MRFLKFILSLNLVIFAVAAFAEMPADTLEQLLQNTRTYQADFTQTVLDNSQIVQQGAGQFLLQRPGKFRWDIKTPNKQLLIANGEKLWIYDPDLEQVTIQKVAKAAGNTPALLLAGESQSLSRDFTISTVNKNGGQGFQLIPKSSNEHFKKVQLYFKQAELQEMVLDDQLGHTTKIQFKHVRINQALNTNLFNFMPPKGVDVIENN